MNPEASCGVRKQKIDQSGPHGIDTFSVTNIVEVHIAVAVCIAIKKYWHDRSRLQYGLLAESHRQKIDEAQDVVKVQVPIIIHVTGQ